MSSYIWAPHQDNSWEVAQVIQHDDNSTSIKYVCDSTTRKFTVPLTSFDGVSPETLKEDIDNLVNLDVFNEGTILHHVKKRFMKDAIYTYVGNILVAVNPYKTVDIYGIDVMERCLEAYKTDSVPFPHVYSIAAQSLTLLKSEHRDQSVLISGESGAGKTEATKKILQFLSSVSSSTASRAGISVERQILDSNPLLESFGNAKTLRNNNSSRFGKYMQINFTKRHDIKGCNITCYLLEKTRLVRQGTGERNYHIFYMLLAGASIEMRKEFSLKPADQCYYLNQSKCLDIPGRNEVKEYQELVTAMKNLTFSQDMQHKVFQILAALLHLGNIQFAPLHDSGGVEGSHVKNKADLKIASNLFGFANYEHVERAMCFKERVIAGETSYTPIDVKMAADQRDALAKFIYGKLFDILVYHINRALYRGKPGNNIGILDIFGFEVFLVNSFEQLCINYCNERLQTFFNEIIFEGEMKVYEEEGIACDSITFADNKGCVRLIDLKGASIFSFLDEEILVPKGSEEKLIKKLHNVFEETSATKSKYYSRNRKKPSNFIISHFAGNVEYEIASFMEKNKDTLAPALLHIADSSALDFLNQPVPVLNMESDDSVATPIPEPTKSKKKTNKLTLCAKFKMDLDSLLNTLRSTVPHFIRCVKPNDKQSANKFDSTLALNQLKYSGLFEAIRIRKAGYQCRIPHEQFIQTFKTCVYEKDVVGGTRKNWLIKSNDDQLNHKIENDKKTKKPPAICHGFLTFLAKEIGMMNPSDPKLPQHWVVGKKRVFIRTQEFKAKLDIYRTEKVLGQAIVRIQKIARGYNARRKTAHLFKGNSKVAKREATKKLEAVERFQMKVEDDLSREYEKEFAADFELQTSIRAAREKNRKMRELKEKQDRLNGAILIQATFRGCRGRMFGRIYMLEILLERAIRKRHDSDLENSIRLTTGFFYALHHLQYKPQRKSNSDVVKLTKSKSPFSNVDTEVLTPMQQYHKQQSLHHVCTWGYSTKLLHAYHQNAKEILLEAQGEMYMADELRNAINTHSVEILKDAIKTAESLHMDYLPELAEATNALQEIVRNREVLSTLEDILSQCTTVPKLILHCDKISELIKTSTKIGLAGEYVVHNAATRLTKVQNLTQLRDQMRYSVEIASVSFMHKALKDREKYVKIFGEELLELELNAIKGLLRMFAYEESLKRASKNLGKEAHIVEAPIDDASSSSDNISETDVKERESVSTICSSDSEPIIQEEPHSLVSSLKTERQAEKARSVSVDFAGENIKKYVPEDGEIIDDNFFENEVATTHASDARLPPSIRSLLEEMRYANTEEELVLAGDRLVSFLPNECIRKQCITAFKWVVAFASWKYEFKTEEEVLAYDFQKRVISESMNSPMKQQYVIDNQDCVYKRPKKLLEVLTATGVSFGSPIKAVNKQKSNRQAVLQNNQKLQSTKVGVAWENKEDRRRMSIQSNATRISNFSSSSSNFGGSTISRKTSNSNTTSKSNSNSNRNVLYSNRKAKSEVAALEALKKSKTIAGLSNSVVSNAKPGRAEDLIKSSIERNEKLFKKFQKKRAWA